MSASVGGGDGQEVELNLAPIIDCFTVLITYLLISASFISLGVLEVGVAASGSGEAAAATGEVPPTLIVHMKAGQVLDLKLTGGAKNLNDVRTAGPVNGKDWNTALLLQWVARTKTEHPSIGDITIQVDPAVNYSGIVQLIEALKQQIPKVYLGG